MNSQHIFSLDFVSASRALSDIRLDSYKRSNFDLDEEVVIDRYLHNIDLCKELYLPLNFLEVTFRNEMDRCLTAFAGKFWYKESWLQEAEKKSIQKTEKTLKALGKSLKKDSIIASQTLGFWTGFFQRRYNSTLWSKDYNLLSKKNNYVFLRHTTNRKDRHREVVYKKINKIRILRNRVFHYEPIWHDLQLSLKYQDILELLFWINPDVADFVKMSSSNFQIMCIRRRP